ncbi:MAG: hypothetical protein HOY78_02175 [Saccharothrix sp.]|nr:hypothetical protein [Saccharothrix sp.]
MTETEKPDRFYVDVTIHDHESGARRSVTSTITEDGDLAEELLEAVLAVAATVGHRDHLLAHVAELAGRHATTSDKDALLGVVLRSLYRQPNVVAVGVETGRTDELDRVVGLLDEADWLQGREPHERVEALLDAARTGQGLSAEVPHRTDSPSSAERKAEDAPEPMPRSLAEQEGEDPADDKSFLGPRAARPVRDVHLPEPEPAESGV